jgi:hypothetical protein
MLKCYPETSPISEQASFLTTLHLFPIPKLKRQLQQRLIVP